MTGVDNYDDAKSQIQTWRDQAKGTGPTKADHDKATDQIKGYFKATEAKNYDDSIANIMGMKNSLNKIWSSLDVKDEESAVKTIHELKADNAKFEKQIKELEKGKEDFEKRVNAEVLTRAASAGITEPVKRVPLVQTVEGGRESNRMSRAEFNILNPQQKLDFSRAGGVLTD